MDGNIYLINLVKKRPVLWNKSCKNVRDFDARNAAWKEIAAIIGVETDWVRTRWYNLRERFVKELKLSYNDKQSKFKYYDEMLFLAKQVEFRRKPDVEFAAFIEQLPDTGIVSFNAEFDFTEEMVEQAEPLEDECIFKELNKNNFENSTELIKAVSDFSPNKRQAEKTGVIEETVSDDQAQAQSTECNLCCQKESGTKLLNHETITQEHRCEDAIFGELVTAILRKMSENKKKSAKKKIISILLE